jgi:hypothetical protein
MKQIKYYRTVQYGLTREFVHPDCQGDRDILFRLTGQRTISGVTRELIRDLTGGMVNFIEVLAP